MFQNPPNPPIFYLLKSSLLASKQWVVLSYPFVPLFFLPSNFRSLLSPCLIALLVLGMYKIRIDVVFSFFFTGLWKSYHSTEGQSQEKLMSRTMSGFHTTVEVP